MQRILSTCLDAAVAAILILPIFLLLHKSYFRSKSKTFLYYLFVVYLCAMFAVVGLPDIRYIRFSPKFNFIPFKYMFSDLDSTLLNVLLFLPLGFFLPLCWCAFKRLFSTLLFGFSVSLLIEALQIFSYRASDVNDLITNTIGSLLGWCLATLLLHFNPQFHPGKETKDVYRLCTIAFFVMFLIHPFFAK